MSNPTSVPAITPDPVMTDEQKFVFDLKGWLLIPAVLPEAQCAEIREFLSVLKATPEKIAAKDRATYGGPVAELHDHPTVMAVLRSIIAHDTNENAYGVRLDGHYCQFRQAGNDGIDPHGGAPGPGLFTYQFKNNRMYSGLTRVVWELNEVEKGAGGTLLMSGSHKSGYSVPKEHLVKSSPLFETYSCPPGSMLVFTESLCHSGAMWKSQIPRVAVFNCYADHQTQFHKMRWAAEIIAGWSKKRQSLVRGVWHADFSKSPPIINNWYGEDNKSY